MAAIQFNARLTNKKGDCSAELVLILFGDDSLAEKERSFRAICRKKYPGLSIDEPITAVPSKLG